MKKSLFAAGAASVTLAAMPIVGVFATPVKTTELVDTVQVTIPTSCTVTTTATGATTETVTEGTAPSQVTFMRVTNPTLAVTMMNGQLLREIGNSSTGGGGTTDPTVTPTDTGSSVSVVCNNEVERDPSDTPLPTDLDAWKLTAKATNGVTAMVGQSDSSHTIAAGTATSGADSAWAYRVIGATSENYVAVTSTEVPVVSGNGNTSSPLKMRYQVYVSPSQEADVYTGSVTYTLYSPAE